MFNIPEAQAIALLPGLSCSLCSLLPESDIFLFSFVSSVSFIAFSTVCEHAYSMAQNLDPNSEGRGVLQFKTGLMSVIKVTSCVYKIFS